MLIRLLIAFVIFLNFNYAYAKMCETHESCVPGNLCECVISPSSAYHRYFYFELSPVKKHHIYQCMLRGGPSTLFLELSMSRFPSGMRYNCAGSCPTFPLILELNTKEMIENESTVSLKYFVPASDIPDIVVMYCRIKERYQKDRD